MNYGRFDSRAVLKTSTAIIAAVVILGLSLAAFPLTTTQAQSQPPNSINLVVYPDGSVTFSLNVQNSTYATPGTEPSENFEANSSTLNGQTTVRASGTVSVPSTIANEAPFNYSNTISASGNYSNGVSKGNVNIQVAPGFTSPLTSFGLSYLGNSSNVSVTGSSTLAYGNYSLGTNSTVELNATSIAQYISLAQQEGFNQTSLNKLVGQIPDATLGVQNFAITPTYGSNSANVSLLFELSGNITALPGGLAIYEYCLSQAASNSSVTLSTCESSQTATTLFNSIEGSVPSATSYTYSVSYSSSMFGFSAVVVEPGPLYLNGSELFGSYSTYTNASSTAFQYLNSTRVDLSQFHSQFSISQLTNGTVTFKASVSNVTVYSSAFKNGSAVDLAPLFESLGNSTQSVTITGGSQGGTTVVIFVPPGVPQPTSTTPNSATWNSVQLSSLSGVEFTSCTGSQCSSFTNTSLTSISTQTATLTATGANGQTVNVVVTGNVTASQITSLQLTNTSNTYNLSFTVSGQTGTSGTMTITVPKSSVPNGLVPTVNVDGSPAAIQSYTQDSSNYYITFTTHFSTHAVQIVFSIPVTTTTTTTSTATTPPPPTPISYDLIIGIVVVVVIIAAGLVFVMRRNKGQGN